MLKIIIVTLLLASSVAQAQVTNCVPDGNGGFRCTAQPCPKGFNCLR